MYCIFKCFWKIGNLGKLYNDRGVSVFFVKFFDELVEGFFEN